MSHLRSEVEKRLEQIRTLKAELDWLLKDQPVTVVSKYNGQPYGSSRPALTGRVRRIKSTYLHEFQVPCLALFIDGERLGLQLGEVRFENEVTEQAQAASAPTGAGQAAQNKS